MLAVGSVVYGSRTVRGPILDHFKIYFVDFDPFVESRLYLPADSGFDVETITIESLAQEMDAIREAFGFETVALLGHSMFGNFALEYARRYPERVTRVVVVEGELHRLPNATFHLFEKSGHTPQFEEPELFAEKLIEWFEKTSPGR